MQVPEDSADNIKSPHDGPWHNGVPSNTDIQRSYDTGKRQGGLSFNSVFLYAILPDHKRTIARFFKAVSRIVVRGIHDYFVPKALEADSGVDDQSLCAAYGDQVWKDRGQSLG